MDGRPADSGEIGADGNGDDDDNGGGDIGPAECRIYGTPQHVGRDENIC